MRRCHCTTATALRLIAIVSVALFASTAFAQTSTIPTTYTWTAPTTGSPVAHYVVQSSIGGGTWTQIATVTTASYVLAAQIGSSYQIRVAGVDAQNRQGVWSPASSAYIPDLGAPGMPGKPVKTP